ncbi:MAG TPA: nucleotidyltransferase family protein [Candidatus Acidoferrales bacterium]|nr:nucleotidyltransferase family protein [Candidatus Acidoferrales bacterium]
MSHRTGENPLEVQLLVACARKVMDAEQRSRFTELVTQPLDWPLILQLANDNGLLPLLHKHLTEAAADSIPPDVLKRISQANREGALRGLLLTAELMRILDAFRQRGIRAIPYKGPVLAERAYGSPSLRQFVDLDIVTPQRFMPAVYDAMESLDYQARLPRERFLAKDSRAIPGEYVFVHRINSAMVELHTEWTLRHFPVPPDIETMIGRAIRVQINNREVPAFAAEDVLLMLAVHGAKDFWARLVWVADIAELVKQSPNIDWEKLREDAHKLKVNRMLNLSLSLAREILDLKLPPEIVNQIESDATVKRLTRRFVLHPVNGEAIPAGIFQRSLYRIRMVEGLWNGLRYWARLTMSPAEEDWAMTDIPRRLSGSYALLRPFRLWKKYGQRGSHRE